VHLDLVSRKKIETDYSKPAVLSVVQTAKKVHREMHRMKLSPGFN
jgi:hypothetical protein